MKLIKAIFFLSLIAILGAGAWLVWYANQPLKVYPLPRSFTVANGTSLDRLAAELHQEGIVHAPWSFRLLGRALGKSTALKAGIYDIVRPMTPIELLEKIERGDVSKVAVQFIEGWTSREIRAALRKQILLEHRSEAMDDQALLAAIGAPERHPEGLFFPDTYYFDAGSSDIKLYRRAYGVLRERLSDVPELVDHFLARAGRPAAFDSVLRRALRVASSSASILFRHRTSGFSVRPPP
mgnify:CR=1 FL=1